VDSVITVTLSTDFLFGVIMAKLTVSFNDLYTKVSEFLGLGSSPTGTDLTKVKDIVKRGYRMFLYPVDQLTGDIHHWSFVKQFYTLNITNGKWKYLLPEDFSDMISAPAFADDTAYPPLVKVGPEQMREARSLSTSIGFPKQYALAPFKYDLQTGTRYEFWVDPDPDGSYVINFWYRIDPDAPSDDADLLVGGIRGAEALIECCLAKAEQQEDDKVGMHTGLAKEALQSLIMTDIKDTSDFLGNLAHGKPSPYRWFNAIPKNNSADNVYVGD
jgi:hypothetical protein